MKNLQLKELLVLSRREKAARRLTFGPEKTVIFGPNGSGKSSLLKTIFTTFGAAPDVVADEWQEAAVESVVRFSVNGVEHAICHVGRWFGLFRGSELIGAYPQVTGEFCAAFSDLVEFRLILPDRNGIARIPPPAYYFVPYYLDQDVGWATSLSSFGPLHQFTNWKEPVLEYHTGIRDNLWYETLARLAATRAAREEPLGQHRTVSGMAATLEARLAAPDIEMSEDEVRQRAEDLRGEVERLHVQERKYFASVTDLASQRHVLARQISILRAATREIESDYEFSADSPGQFVCCPTCGAEFENSFRERFALALDSTVCRDLTQRLTLDLRECEADLSADESRLSSVRSALRDLEAALDAAAGELTVRDVLRTAGRQELRRAVQERLTELEGEIGRLDAEESELLARKRELDGANRERADGIRERFWLRYEAFINRLGVRQRIRSRGRIAMKVGGTGTIRPRMALAYAVALYTSVSDGAPGVVAPFVLDSPRQQDMDAVNWNTAVRFLGDVLPGRRQFVLAAVDVPSDFSADHRVRLGGERALLPEDYSGVREAMAPYVDAVLGAGSP